MLSARHLKKQKPDLAVICHRVDLFDSHHSFRDRPLPAQREQQDLEVRPYSFSVESGNQNHVASCRAPPLTPLPSTEEGEDWHCLETVDNVTPNPCTCDDKYWRQRRRLFRLFDHGIQLDDEGWFSVTPEQIAHHVGSCVQDLVEPTEGQQTVILDAFCGCAGNSIAFAKKVRNSLVVAVDINRNRLRKAAANASIYSIPTDQIVFIECNVVFLLDFCYKNGQYMLDQPIDDPDRILQLMAAMPPPVETEVTSEGYRIGGIDLLPRRVDLVFMDPPWGGVDYEVFGKHGYDLSRNMRIQRPGVAPPASLDSSFFDAFQPQTVQERKAQFNQKVDESHCVNGAELLALAASATEKHLVVYDMPRNTNRTSLGQAALHAGYRGNIKLDEHYLNGRLKTVTAYFGSDWSHLI